LLKDILPNFEFTPFEEGIKETVDWFSAEYDGCKK
jgi:hypothetical protein